MNLFVKMSAVAACVALSSCVLVVNAGEASYDQPRDADRNSVNRDITLPAGSFVEDVSSVNGNIDIGDTSVAESVTSVNGDIRIGQRCRIESIESVNGRMHVGAGSTIGDDIEVVNGDIELLAEVRIGGDISTVNGALTATAATVHGSVETVHGRIDLRDGTRVDGGLHVEDTGNNRKLAKRVVIVLGQDVVVAGESVFERPVEIHQHATASLGSYRGDDVKIMPLD